MKIKHYESIKNCPELKDALWLLLKEVDQEFVPPLSARNSSKQNNLLESTNSQHGPIQYFNEIVENQAFIFMFDKEKPIGFMTYIPGFNTEALEKYPDSNYVSTVAITKDYRGRGYARQFYEKLFNLSKPTNTPVTTRTWTQNYSHIKILKRLGFEVITVLKDHRGEGIDTQYFATNPGFERSEAQGQRKG